MQFTPQQLAGGACYSDSTRIGNWVEDVCLRDYQKAHFEDKKKTGSLELQRRRAKLNSGNAPVTPHNSGESSLSFGDVICLDHNQNLRLAVDIWDEILPGKSVYSVSAVPGSGGRSTTGPEPAARTCFQIVTQDGSNIDNGTPVTFGTPFRLKSMLVADEVAVNDGLLEAKPDFYLASTLKSERMASRLTNRQLVFATSGVTAETLWTFERATYSMGIESSEDKYFSTGQPVQYGDAVVIQHKATRQGLLADPAQTEHTDFGAECEVVCKTVKPVNFVSSMTREAKGSAILTGPLETPENHWAVTRA
jgi:hypothetical protein